MVRISREDAESCKIFRRMGFTFREISDHFRASVSTIRRCCMCQGKKKKKARKTCTSVFKRRKLVRAIARRRQKVGGRVYPVFCSASQMSRELAKKGVHASKWTVIRDLHFLGFRSRVRVRVPTRDPKVFSDRLRFATKWLLNGPRACSKIVFSDEHTVSINDYGNRRMFVLEDEEVIPRERRRLQNIPRVMVWAAVGVGYKSPIILFPGTMETQEGKTVFRLNSASYVRKCLSRVRGSLAGKVFQQDGAKPHANDRVRTYLRRHKVQYIEDWPPYSPDLNMIELVWPLLNRRVAEYHPETLEELKPAIVRAWASISQAEIDAICSNFHQKLAEVRAKGGRC